MQSQRTHHQPTEGKAHAGHRGRQPMARPSARQEIHAEAGQELALREEGFGLEPGRFAGLLQRGEVDVGREVLPAGIGRAKVVEAIPESVIKEAILKYTAK